MVIAPLRGLEDDLQLVEAALLNILETRGGNLRCPAEVLFRTGGKRLRPALVLLASRATAGQSQGAIRLAAAVEMIHGASLLHDDVLDGTTVRRGAETLNSTHGNHFTVLLGDWLLCQALLAIAELGQVELLQVISAAVADMTNGQILEANLQGRIDVATDQYLAVVEGKTAALMAAGCRLAALLSGAPDDQVEALTRFGRKLGLAFQIVDDVLDYWGDASVLGKPTGSDLRERKYTLPFLDAFWRSAPHEQTKIRTLLGNGKLDNGGLLEVVEWMEGYQARERALQMAVDFANEARAALATLPPSPAKESLEQLLAYITERER